MVTDHIANLLTRIRNAARAGHESVEVPNTKQCFEVAKILAAEGFVSSCETVPGKGNGSIRIALRYTEGQEPVLTQLKRISRPGLRVYAKADKLPRVLKGLGIAIISTSQGVITDREARRRGIGGEVVCYVW
jgi:small subunit ribosomal protein S8